jgi:hypothetical protein
MPEGEEKKKEVKKTIRDARPKGGDFADETHAREFYNTIAPRGDVKINPRRAHGKRGR